MSEKKTHYLITMVGMSPAVVTETVYQLDTENNTPDEVIAITTQEGAEEIKKQLLQKNDGESVWDRLNAQLHHPVKFGPANIRIIPDDEAGFSTDINNTNSNNIMADYLLNQLTGYTEKEDSRISFSIAGGRKSMSAMGALVMTLVGRLEDKMYHILVNHPFDFPNLKPQFYFPEPGKIHEFKNKDGEIEKHNSTDALLCLGEVPFLRCRYWFDEKGIPRKNYMNMVDSFNSNQLQIVLNTKKHSITINEQEVKLPEMSFYLYWMFAEKHLRKEKRLEVGMLEQEFKNFHQSKGKIFPEDAVKKEKLIKAIGKVREKISATLECTDDLSDKLGLSRGYSYYGITREIVVNISIIPNEGE